MKTKPNLARQAMAQRAYNHVVARYEQFKLQVVILNKRNTVKGHECEGDGR